MTQTFTAHFDGKVIVPDEPVQLPVGQPLSDLAAQHDHYLYGSPKQ
jgi:hypothetical protein